MTVAVAEVPVAQGGSELPDDDVRAVRAALLEFERSGGTVRVVRPNWASLHVRVVSDDFEGVPEEKREDRVWAALDALPDDTYGYVTRVLTRTPAEAAHAPAEADAASTVARRSLARRDAWATVRPSPGGFSAGYCFGRFPAGDATTAVPGDYPTAPAAADAAFREAAAAAVQPAA